MKGEKYTKQSLSCALYNVLIRETLVPLFLMITTPNVAILFPYIIIVKNSNLSRTILLDSLQKTLSEAWNSVKWFVKLDFIFK